MKANRHSASVFCSALLVTAAFAQTKTNTFPDSGNVGIGTTLPPAKLTLSGAGGSATNNGIEWYSGGNASGYAGWVGRIYSGVPTGGWGTAPFVFSVPDSSGGERLTMALLAGNVGIGAATPTAKLQIGISNAGSVNEGIELARLGGATSKVGLKLKSNAGGYYRGVLEFTPNGGTTAEVLTFGNEAAGNLGVGCVGIGTANPIARLQVTAPDSGTFATMVLDGSRTTNANTLLFRNSYWSAESDAYGYAFVRGLDTGAQGGSLVFATTGNNSGTTGTPTERVRITSSGNVGIGTAAPLVRLHIAAPDSTAMLQIQNTTANRIWEFQTNTDGNFHFNACGAAADVIKAVHSGSVANTMVLQAGNVGIGTTNPTNKLEVNGTIRTKEVIVETTGWSDYVFAPDYRLAPLSEVEAHIQAKGTLPGIPSAAEVAERGVGLGDMQAKLLAKMEEMTLHMIALSKKVDAQSAQLSAQATEIATLKADNAALRQP